MKDEDDVADYITAFWSLCEPLLTSYYMSLTECKDLFWQGFHPDDHAKISPQVEQQNQDLLQRALPQFAEHTCRTLPVGTHYCLAVGNDEGLELDEADEDEKPSEGDEE